ncbi:MAG: MFS transporter, partial [Desulfobacterium sp.]|nr:MFS transporter [Desulfobacterium sp.]
MDTPASHQIVNSVKARLFLCAVAIWAVALGFNALFSFTTLDKLYTDYAALKFNVIGEDLRREIKGSLLSGQSIQKNTEIKEKFTKAKQRIERFSYESAARLSPDAILFFDGNAVVSIYLPDGQLLYSTDKKQLKPEAFVPLEDPNTIKKEKRSFVRQSPVIKKKGIRFLQFPIQDAQNNWVATLILSYKNNRLNNPFKSHLNKQIVSGLVIFWTVGILLVIVLNVLFSRAYPCREFPKKVCTLAMFSIVAPSLVLFSSLNTYDATKKYLEICQKKAWMTLAIAKEDVESLLVQGRTLEEAAKSDEVGIDAFKPHPLIESLSILDNEDNLVLETRQELVALSGAYRRMGDVLNSKIPLLNQTLRLKIFNGKKQTFSGFVVLGISTDQFVREAVNIILNAVTVVIISILFLIELLIFMFHFIEKPIFRDKKPQPVHYGLIRPVTFLFLFGIDISISFIPLHMEKLITPMFGLSKDAVMGLPISVEFFFVGIAIFFCGFWNDRRGWYEPFLVGLFLAGTGVLYSWLAPNVIHFIISRAIVGIGYGLTLLACQGFVITFSDEKTKAQAFAQFIAGLYAGSICGGATGALLAEKIGYRWVFFIGAILLYSIIGYSLIFMGSAMIRPQRQKTVKQHQSLSGKSIFSIFFKNRIVLSLILLSSLPASIAAVGFLNYFSPISELLTSDNLKCNLCRPKYQAKVRS